AVPIRAVCWRRRGSVGGRLADLGHSHRAPAHRGHGSWLFAAEPRLTVSRGTSLPTIGRTSGRAQTDEAAPRWDPGIDTRLRSNLQFAGRRPSARSGLVGSRARTT